MRTLTDTERKRILKRINPITSKIQKLVKKGKVKTPLDLHDAAKILNLVDLDVSEESCTGNLFLKCDKRKIVVKSSYLSKSGKRAKNIDQYKVPTTAIKIASGDVIFVQPLVSMKKTHDAVKLFEDIPEVYEDVDLHSGNVGWYNRKAVLIDW